MKRRWFSALGIALSIAAMPLQANESRSDNLKTLFQVIFSDVFLESIAQVTIDSQNLDLDPAILAEQFREEMRREPTFAQLTEPYALFSDEEIACLAAMFSSPVYQKFVTEGKEPMMANFQTIQTVLSDLALASGAPVQSPPEETASSSIIEVTGENFDATVEQSEMPVIIDVYAPWCGPCKKLSPILRKLSERFPEIRFVKINCDTESEIASRYKVHSLPTLLFVLPGKSNPVMKSVGLLTEEALEAKIVEFQNLFSEN